VLASQLMANVVLPIGLADAKGRRSRSAGLVPISGRGEMLAAEDANPFRAALQLLVMSTVRLGPFQAEEIDLGLLSSLLPIDRDYLLVQLVRLTFGDVRYQTVTCPAAGCGKRLDIQLDLSTVRAPAVEEKVAPLALPDGRLVRFRRPTCGDQVALHGLSPGELETAFIARLVLPASGEPAGLSADQIAALPAELRAALVRQMVAASPDLELTTELACAECGVQFCYEYDPVVALLDELRTSRRAILQQLHSLAFYYHWSPSEILNLTRSQRAEFLQLLGDELGAQARGAAR